MIVLGLILLIVVAVVAITALLRGDDVTSLNLVGADLETSVRWVFLAGATSVLLLVVGVSLLAGGLRRARSKRQEIKQLKSAAGPSATSSTMVTSDGSRGVTASPPGGSRDVSGAAQHQAPVSPQDPDEQEHFESTPRE